MTKWLISIISVFIALNSYGWNAAGHRLVAQIAYDNLTSSAKEKSNYYIKVLKVKPTPKFSSLNDFVNSAPWLDTLRKNKILKWQNKHYINLAYITDNKRNREPPPINAVSAIEGAITRLNNPHTSETNKGIQLRILLHVIGDLHQPLHACSLFSNRFPQGDLGGNLYPLHHSAIATNLHHYWDLGGGWLQPSFSSKELKKQAKKLEKRYPCPFEKTDKKPTDWAWESHQLAINYAYKTPSFQKPSFYYQKTVQKISKRQIAKAGCRLAATLNKIFP